MNGSITLSAVKGNPIRSQLIIMGGFFFLFGFVTWVNGSLIPYLTIACELKIWQAYLVTFAFYISYTVMAFPASKLLQYTGMVKGMQVGLLIMALGCALFIPAAISRTYLLFLIGLFIVGIGLTLLQTAVNPYITVLGPINKAAQRISLMGICNKFAGMLAPLILGSIILRNSEGLIVELESMDMMAKTARLDELARLVIMPYCALTLILVLASIGMKYAHLPEIGITEGLSNDYNDKIQKGPESKISRLPIWTGFIAIFATVGAEVIAGDTIANYGLYHGVSLNIAKNLTSLTLFGMIVGYLAGIFAIPKFISQEKAFLYSSILGIVVVLLIILLPGELSIAMVALLGFTNALLWPAIWPQALKGLSGPKLNFASAILIMGIAGGAIMPLLYGWIATFINLQWAYIILIPAYLYNVNYWRMGSQENNYEKLKSLSKEYGK